MRRIALISCVVAITLAPTPTRAAEVAGSVVVSEVYGGGGNTQATYRNDFVELFNRTRSSIDLTAWKLQYSPATGTTWSSAALSGSIAAYRYVLVRLGSGGTSGAALPAHDIAGSMNIARSAGKVRLTGATGAVIDLVGYGSTANAYEGARAPGVSRNTESLGRINSGCTDTNRNDKDFKVQTAPSPRNRASQGSNCGSPPVLAPIGNKSTTVGNTLSFTISATDADGDRLTYSASGLPTGATFDPAARRFSWAPRSNNVGDHRVTFRVSDGFSNDSETITITVRPDPYDGRSVTTLNVTHQARTLLASGAVSPNHAGFTVTLKLSRRQAGTYNRILVVRTRLDTRSSYSEALPRPRTGTCLVQAIFAGDADHAGSRAERVIPC